jgi:hypothetical protein
MLLIGDHQWQPDCADVLANFRGKSMRICVFLICGEKCIRSDLPVVNHRLMVALKMSGLRNDHE